MTRRHPREAGSRRAAEHVEQDRLRLVVGRVRDEHAFRAQLLTRALERAVALVAGPGFEVGARPDVDGDGEEARAETDRDFADCNGLVGARRP